MRHEVCGLVVQQQVPEPRRRQKHDDRDAEVEQGRDPVELLGPLVKHACRLGRRRRPLPPDGALPRMTVAGGWVADSPPAAHRLR